MKNKNYTIVRVLIVHIFLFCFTKVYSQKYSLQPYLGLGSTLSTVDKANQKSRAKIGLSFYYHFKEQLHFGVDISSSGSAINLLGGSSQEEIYGPSTNTITLYAKNMNATTFLLKGRYFFTATKQLVHPYVELGLGVNTYYQKMFNIPALPSEKVSKTNLGIQPEMGCFIGPFFASITYLNGGLTPSYKGVNTAGNNVQLNSIRISPLYLNVGGRLKI